MDQVLSLLGFDFAWTRFVLVVGLIFARLIPLIALLPFLFSEPVPNMVRMGAIGALTIFLFPLVNHQVPADWDPEFIYLIVLFLKELLIGVAIGFAASIIFYAFDAAGQVVDNQRGASMAQIFSPQTGQQVTIFGQFMFQLAVVIFLTIGGHQLFLGALFESFEKLPVVAMPVPGDHLMLLAEHFMIITGRVLLVAAQLTAPILISIFITDIVLGVMNRISPAVNVLTLGFAVRGVMGVLIFAIAFTVVAGQVQILSLESIQHVRQAITFMAGG